MTNFSLRLNSVFMQKNLICNRTFCNSLLQEYKFLMFPFTVATPCTLAQTGYRCTSGSCVDLYSECSVQKCQLSARVSLSVSGHRGPVTLGTETERQGAGSQGRYGGIRMAFSLSIRTCYNSDMAPRQIPSLCDTQRSISICFTHCSNIVRVFVGIVHR